MQHESAAQVAERLVRRRARLIPVFLILFLGWQANYALLPNHSARPVDQVKIAAWLVWALVLLLVFATGGGFFRGKAVRALLNDETTREHRRTAYVFGFWAAIACSVLLYAAQIFEPVPGREAVHLIITASVAATLLAFGVLERRSLRDG
jgi:cation transport ATPase